MNAPLPVLEAEHITSDADYFIVATMHVSHHATYAEAKIALAEQQASMAASSKRRTRKRAQELRIYRCHSFGRPCREKGHDGSGFVHAPLEATREMLSAGVGPLPFGAYTLDSVQASYAAMIEARPDPRAALVNGSSTAAHREDE